MSTGDKMEQPYEGQKFKSFDAVKKYLEEYGQKNYVKFWIRSSHTRNSLKSKISKTMNPDLKYVCIKFACIFGGEKIRCRGSGIRKSSTYRDLGCPCMINAVVGEDGNHVKLDSVILEHNHVLCKTLYDSLKKTKRKSLAIKNNQEFVHNNNSLTDCKDLQLDDDSSYLIFEGESQGQEDSSCNEISNVEKDEILIEQTESESTQNCLQNIQDKYGRNVKILVVNSENTSNEFDDLLKFNEKENKILENDSKEEKNEICRLCLSPNDKLSPIFNPELPLKSTILSFKIMGCASIEISCDDGLPNSICTTCEADLDVAYKFRIRCENSDSILRKNYLKKEVLPSPDDLVLKDCTENLLAGSSQVEKNIFPESLINYHETAEEEEENLIAEAGSEGRTQDSVYVQFVPACPVCGSDQETYESMLDHLETHPDEETLLLACNLCDLMCSTVKELKEHMGNHWNEINPNSFCCRHCDTSFATPEEQKIHEEESHSVAVENQTRKQSESNYLCNFCGKIIKSKDRFRSHRNTHEGLRPHVCLKCGRGFADRKNMHHHYNVVHLRKPKLDCPVCHKKFYTRTKMKSHVTMHYGLKPFACDVCGKTFRLKMNMIKHKKTHSNDRPHKCDKCSAAFIDKNMLKRHSFIHGGIRPHPCPVCGHRFSVKFHLKKHLEKSKCGKSQSLVPPENYQWMEITEPETDLAGNECLVVYKPDEEREQLRQENPEDITMNILQEYQEESNS